MATDSDDEPLFSSILKKKWISPASTTIRKKATKKARHNAPKMDEGTDEVLLIEALLEDDITPEEIERGFGPKRDCRVVTLR